MKSNSSPKIKNKNKKISNSVDKTEIVKTKKIKAQKIENGETNSKINEGSKKVKKSVVTKGIEKPFKLKSEIKISEEQNKDITNKKNVKNLTKNLDSKKPKKLKSGNLNAKKNKTEKNILNEIINGKKNLNINKKEKKPKAKKENGDLQDFEEKIEKNEVVKRPREDEISSDVKKQKRKKYFDSYKKPVSIKLSVGDSIRTLEEAVSTDTINSLWESGYRVLSKIQAEAIPKLLTYNDVHICSNSLSGKTLAYLIPLIEIIKKAKITFEHGLCAVILVDSPENGSAIFGIISQILMDSNISFGIFDEENSKQNVFKDCNILVATPDILLTHIWKRDDKIRRQLLCLVFDGDFGSTSDDIMAALLTEFKNRMVTVVVSTSRNEHSEAIASVALKATKQMAVAKETVPLEEALKTMFISCATENRFVAMYTFLRAHEGQKVAVYFETKSEAKFYKKILSQCSKLKFYCVEGLSKKDRKAELMKYASEQSGVLLFSTAGLMHGFLPNSDWLVQYGHPSSARSFLHRLTRQRLTCVSGSSSQKSLMLLSPEQEIFKDSLKDDHGVVFEEMSFAWNKINAKQLRQKMCKMVASNRALFEQGVNEFSAFVRASMAEGKMYDIESVKLEKLCFCYGLEEPYLCDENEVNEEMKNEESEDDNEEGEEGEEEEEDGDEEETDEDETEDEEESDDEGEGEEESDVDQSEDDDDDGQESDDELSSSDYE